MRLLKLFLLLPVSPKTTWNKINEEEISNVRLIVLYLFTSTLTPLIFQIIHLAILGRPLTGSSSFVVSYLFIFEFLITLLLTDAVLSILISQFSSLFGGEKSYNASLKLVVFSKLVVILFGFLTFIFQRNFIANIGILCQNLLLFFGYHEILKIEKKKCTGFAIFVFLMYSISKLLISIASIYVMYHTLNLNT